jgi:hypothetical protein
MQMLDDKHHPNQRGMVPPKLFPSEGKDWDVCPLGAVQLTELIHDGTHGRVYAAKINGQEFAVKYVNDWTLRLRGGDEPVINPLVWEHWVMEALAGTNVAPKVFYLSLKAILKPDTRQLLRRHQTNFFSQNQRACLNAQSTVRYLVQERVGPSVRDFIDALTGRNDNTSEFSRKVLILARKALELLERIHRYATSTGTSISEM